jgi:hypothetical protein
MKKKKRNLKNYKRRLNLMNEKEFKNKLKISNFGLEIKISIYSCIDDNNEVMIDYECMEEEFNHKLEQLKRVEDERKA